jgi:hypothetical protein
MKWFRAVAQVVAAAARTALEARTVTQLATDAATQFFSSAEALERLSNSGGGAGRIHAAEVDDPGRVRLAEFLQCVSAQLRPSQLANNCSR